MNKDEQYLISNGWWKKDDTFWFNKHMNPKYGGYGINNALKVQKEHELIDKIGATFYFYRDNLGYGYTIGKYTQKHGMPKRTEYNHLSREEAISLVNRLNNGEIPRQENRLKFNNIILFKEKYGNRYFYVPTKDDLEKVFLKIVLEREKEGWYQFADKEDLEKPEISLEKANKMKDGNIKSSILQEWKNYESELKSYESDIKLKESLNKIVKEKDGKLALQFLQDMKDGEYEGFEMITTESY